MIDLASPLLSARHKTKTFRKGKKKRREKEGFVALVLSLSFHLPTISTFQWGLMRLFLIPLSLPPFSNRGVVPLRDVCVLSRARAQSESLETDVRLSSLE